MDTNRLPKQALHYRPKGRRNLGRPRRKWKDQLGAQNIVKEIKQYQQKWLQHVQRMDTNRLPKQALHYRPKGRRNLGRPRRRWKDQLDLED
jgi:2-keto-3-deoxy-L-rhamnonate aldolase RhmA